MVVDWRPWITKAEKKGRLDKRPPHRFLPLLCRKFLGLAFVPHELERSLGFFVRLRNFFLYLGGRFFHFWREANVAVVLHAGACRNEASDDDVLLQAAQVIHGPLKRCLGQPAGGLLEGGRGDERVGRQRGFGDTQEQRPARGRTSALRDHALVLLGEAEFVDLL